MIKPNGYDESPAYSGEFEDLPNGAYSCMIKNAVSTKSQTGANMLEIWVDIADGEYRGYFQNLYVQQGQNTEKPKWRGIVRQLVDGKSTPYFKGLIFNIEKSNPGYKFDFDESKLVNKKIGGVFRHRQYQANDGALKMAVECWYLCDITKISSIATPEDKLLAISNQSSYYTTPKSEMEEINPNDGFPF